MSYLLQDMPGAAKAWDIDRRPEWAVRKADITARLTECVREEQVRVLVNTLCNEINNFSKDQIKEVARMIHNRQQQLNKGPERLIQWDDVLRTVYLWMQSADVYLEQRDGLRVSGSIIEKYFSLQKRLKRFTVNERIAIKHVIICVHKWLNSKDVWTVDANGEKSDYLIKVKPMSLLSKLSAI